MSKKINQQFNCSKMMLPEHRERLQKQTALSRWKEEHHRPVLDEQQQELLQHIFEQSLLHRQKIKITVLNENGYQVLEGVPLKGTSAVGQISLENSGDVKTVQTKDIVNLEQADNIF
ncbi:MAG TPA: YolD-like family protein [Candidatus Limnocylindrales bacterium]|nr:YolD-like family protein [Candidatus Limnocylindrales bacterium]